MFINNYTLDLDIKKAISKDLPFYVNEDNASMLFRVFNQGEPMDLRVYNEVKIWHVLNPKETVECIGAVSSNGESVSYTLDKRILEKRGFVDVILSMYAENTRVSAQPFKIKIV